MLQSSGIHAVLTSFAALNLLDIASTSLAFQVGLPEGNGLPSMLLDNYGEPGLYLFKAAATLLVMAAVLRLSPFYPRIGYGLRFANWMLIGVVFLNLFQILPV